MNPHVADIPPDGRHRYDVRVYYEDTDAGGVVYHATYLRFAERARTEALRALGIPHAEMLQRFASMFVVRRVEVDYWRPARPDDSLRVDTDVREVGGASAVLRQTVHGPVGLCATLTVRLACVALDSRVGEYRPARIPPQWRDTLVAMRDVRRRRDEDDARQPRDVDDARQPRDGDDARRRRDTATD